MRCIRLLAPVISAALVMGCTTGERSTVLVDLRTDLLSGHDFTHIRTELADELPVAGVLPDDRRVAELPGSGVDDYYAGVRIAEFGEVPRGSHVVRVTLLANGDQVATRIVLLEVRANLAVTVLITRDCARVECPRPGDAPTAISCRGGSCVEPTCVDGSEATCPASECNSAGDCMAMDACAAAECLDGVCAYEPRDDRCAVDERCHPRDGCVGALADSGTSDSGMSDSGTADSGSGDAGASDAGLGDDDAGPDPPDGGRPDAGSVDSGRRDAGPPCMPMTESCNGRDDDCDRGIDEAFDLTSDSMNCGSCGTVCTSPESCMGGLCRCAGGCDCVGSCPGTAPCTCSAGCTCNYACAGDCDVRCPGGNCTLDADGLVLVRATCTAGASCTVDGRRTTNVQVTCGGSGTSCDVDCRSAGTCAVSCSTGASCFLDCTAAGLCDFTSCPGPGGAMSCTASTLVCNRACP